jgi:hypothetical protein
MVIFLLILGFIVLIVAVALLTPKEEEEKLPEKFREPQKQLDEFYKNNNFLIQDVDNQKIEEFIHAFLKRYSLGKEENQKAVLEASKQLIPSLLGIISDYKSGKLESPALADYKRQFERTILENKKNMDFMAIYGITVVELYGKLGVDAKKLKEKEIESVVHKECQAMIKHFSESLKIT